MRIRVLWIDDEYQLLSAFISLAEQFDMDILPFESSEEGLSELKRNVEKYDAVILDVKGRLNSQYTALNHKGFGIAWKEIHFIQGSSGRDLPIFIFTGQPDIINAKDFKDQHGDFFQKGRDEKLLIESISRRVKDSANYKIRLKFNRVLALANDSFIGTNSEPILLGLIMDLSSNEQPINSESKFNNIRKILELMVDRLVKLNIIPSEITKETGRLSKTIRLLSGGVESGYKFTDGVLNPLISESVKWVSNISNDASHATENLKINVHSFIQSQCSPYLYFATIYQLFDILIWFGEFAAKNQDTVSNGNLCIQASIVFEGELQQDVHGNYYCGKYSVVSRDLGIRYFKGDTIQIFESQDNSNSKTKSKYPYFAAKFDKKSVVID
jgi:FixJ family two-component response regulator